MLLPIRSRKFNSVLIVAILFLSLLVDSEAMPRGMTRIQNLFRTLMGPKNDVPMRGKKFFTEFPGIAYGYYPVDIPNNFFSS